VKELINKRVACLILVRVNQTSKAPLRYTLQRNKKELRKKERSSVKDVKATSNLLVK